MNEEYQSPNWDEPVMTPSMKVFTFFAVGSFLVAIAYFVLLIHTLNNPIK